MLANYHTHTARCQHANGEDREYVEAAIQAGIKILGFSDHCPWPFPGDYVSNIRMTPSDLDNYFYSLETLRKEYQKDLTIYIGFEAEYDISLNNAQEALFSDYPLDYLIMGQHFLGKETDSCYTGMPTIDEAMLQLYVERTIQGMQTGKYLYIAHPDLINYTGPDEIYEKHMIQLCTYLKEKDIPVEINLLGLWTHRNYTSRRFLSIAQKVGNSAILGIDAHAPEQLLNSEAEALGVSLCKEFGLPLCEKMEIH